MIEVIGSVLSIGSAVKEAYDVYKTASVILKGEPNNRLLEQLATQVQTMAGQVKRLGDHIYYAPHLQAVRDTTQSRQRTIDDLREVREGLEPVQRALGLDILSSAMILTPEKMRDALAKNPFEVLLDVRPVRFFSARIPPEGVPVLFEHDGVQYLGWQTRGMLPLLFNCEYQDPGVPAPDRGRSRAAPAWAASAQEVVPPARLSVSEVPDIHGWPADRIQALQNLAAQALGRPVFFRDSLQTPVKLPPLRLSGGRFGVPEFIANGPEMAVIPAGSFLMGSPTSDELRNKDEGPQHRVTFAKPFAIGRHAVTFDDYDAFCVATGREKPNDSWGRGRQPVIRVSWDDAVAYCRWLSEQTRRDYRLPSEAQWEYACRAATSTPFHFGAKISTDKANYDGHDSYGLGSKGEYRSQTVPVGSLPPNYWGLYELHGNVWEWCLDCSNDKYGYQGTPKDGSAWLDGGCQARARRGGSWGDSSEWLRSARRSYGASTQGSREVGFRVAMEL